MRFVSAMPLSITPPEVAAAGLTAAQVPAKNSNEGAVLQVLPGAVDMMLLFQVCSVLCIVLHSCVWLGVT